MKDFWENQSLKKHSFIHSVSNLSINKSFSKEKSNNEMKKIQDVNDALTG